MKITVKGEQALPHMLDELSIVLQNAYSLKSWSLTKINLKCNVRVPRTQAEKFNES